MELGEKLKQARLEAGLSQRQLCGGRITRNMLSQIENGKARPSMDTLRFLAQTLHKPLGFFLEETAVTSPNVELMEQARAAYADGQTARALEILSAYQMPDAIFDAERGLLERLCCLCEAERALRQHREPYARKLLERAKNAKTIYTVEQHRCRMLLAEAGGEAALPGLDDTLILYARDALRRGAWERAKSLLEAAQDHGSGRWRLLMGQALFAGKDYASAAAELREAEEDDPQEAYALLEICYRELGDFRQAYEYACRRRKIP